MYCKLVLGMVFAAFCACGNPASNKIQPEQNNPAPVVEQPRHIDSLWVNDGFSWRKQEGYLKLGLSEKLIIYAQNPIQVDSSSIYHINNFELQLNNKLIFSYPRDAKYLNNKPLTMEINTSAPKFPKIVKQSDKKLVVWKVFNADEAEKKYTLQAITIEQDSMKAFLNPLTKDSREAENLDRETWRLIFNEAFDSY